MEIYGYPSEQNPDKRRKINGKKILIRVCVIGIILTTIIIAIPLSNNIVSIMNTPATSSTASIPTSSPPISNDLPISYPPMFNDATISYSGGAGGSGAYTKGIYVIAAGGGGGAVEHWNWSYK